MAGKDRGGFLGRLMQSAVRNGNSIYEEIQGGTIVDRVQQDLQELGPILADTMKGVKGDVKKAIALASPTIDASPGKRTIEDTIDEIIFDPKSPLAPLELAALGITSTSRVAAKGAREAFKKLGWKADDIIQKSSKLRKGKLVLQQPRAVTEGVARRVGVKAGATGTKAGKELQKLIDQTLKVTDVALPKPKLGMSGKVEPAVPTMEGDLLLHFRNSSAVQLAAMRRRLEQLLGEDK
jgi:hypothetical protein